jgi:imidazolonepropionase-like amidohydrolase
MIPDEDWHHINVAAGAKKVIDAGGTVCLGGHGQLQGLGPHWEIWGFVQGGMTPLEALRVATLSPAKTLGLDGDLGSIENGVGYKPEDLERIGSNGTGPSLGSLPAHGDDL